MVRLVTVNRNTANLPLRLCTIYDTSLWLRRLSHSSPLLEIRLRARTGAGLVE
jgi:hypothetical protein